MNINMQQERLIANIRRWGEEYWQFKQMDDRLKKLLPPNLDALKRAKRRSLKTTSSKALRLAYVSQDYLDAIENYVTMREKKLLARMQYDTHMMLYQARQSIQSFHRVAMQQQKHKQGQKSH